MLAIAALLRRGVPVHRRLRVQLHGLRLPLHSVLEVGAADRRRPLGSQREPSTALVLEDVHLLLHHVGALAGRAEEELGVLEHRRDDPAVAVRLGDLGERARGELPERLLRREDVVGPARRLELHWEAERSSARKGLRSSSAPSVVAGAVARVHDRLRRIPLGEQADRVEQRVPVPAGEVDAADAAGEQDVAREEAPVRVIGKVSGRVAGHVEDVEPDARELEGVSTRHVTCSLEAAHLEPGRRERALEPTGRIRRDVDGRAGRVREVGDTAEMVEVRVGEDDRRARAPGGRELGDEPLCVPARIDDDGFPRSLVGPDDVAIRADRAELVRVDCERHRGVESTRGG